jgi:Flp pilus assembly pilin Flp
VTETGRRQPSNCTTNDRRLPFSGATIIEYAIIAFDIAVAVATTVMSSGLSGNGLYSGVARADFK